MLKVGDTAPPIDAVASDGKRFVLSEQTGLCTVLYFFPKAFTPGCTTETKSFATHHAELLFAGAKVVGVSTDDLETQCDFAKSVNAPFPLIGDADRSIARAYDVLWPLIGVTKRVTFVVSRSRLIEAVFRHEIHIDGHRDDVLRYVNAKFQARKNQQPKP